MRNMVVLVPFRAEHREMLRLAAGADFQVTFHPADLPHAEQVSLLRGAEVVIGEPEPDAMAFSEALRWVQITWAGTDRYTGSGRVYPQRLRLTNMSGAYGCVMAEYALSMILAFYRRLLPYRQNQKRHLWRDLNAEDTLEGKTVLLFGAGDIGTRTAERLKAFGAQCVGVRRNTGSRPPCFDEMLSLARAEAFLPRADIVVCCIPETPETRHYLNEKRLSMLKPGALLVNMGRGSFVETDALARFLSAGRLRGAALDVTEPEPLPPDHPLWDMDNVILTPHVAGPGFGHSPETEDKIARFCCGNIRRYLAGEPLQNLIF